MQQSRLLQGASSRLMVPRALSSSRKIRLNNSGKMEADAERCHSRRPKEGISAMRARDDHPLREKSNPCQEGVEPNGDVITESGVTFHLWRLYQHFWLVCLFFPLA